MAVATRFRDALGFPAKAAGAGVHCNQAVNVCVRCFRCTLGQKAVMRAISYCVALAPMWIMWRLRQVQPFPKSLVET